MLYYGTYAFIGLSAKGGLYIEWLKYVDYVGLYRKILLKSSEGLLTILGYNAYTRGSFYLYINGKNGIQLIYECLGIGILSFWVAFVVTDIYGTIKAKLKWVLIGITVVTLLNILRLTLLLVAANKKWVNVMLFDHHTFYNTMLYIIVLGMLLLYRKKIS